MSLKAFLSRELTQNLRIRNIFIRRSYASSSDSAKTEPIDINFVDITPKYDEEISLSKKELQTLRDKSRLKDYHRNILKCRRPYEKYGIAHHHDTLHFKRRMLGQYGIDNSGIPPGVAWPTKEAIAELKEYEKVAYPYTIQESWEIIAAKHKEEEEAIIAREDSIAAKLAKTKQWEKELNAKLAKKESEIRVAKERKERLVEEVRRHFGFKVDPRDEKFREMLEMKEKEDKKRRKDAKKKERTEKMMAHLLNQASEKQGSLDVQKKNEEKTQPPAELS